MLRRLIILLLIVGLHAGYSDTLNPPKDSYKFLSLGIGAATKDLNYLQITYDRRLYKNVSIYGYLGLGTFLGYGISWQQNYNNNGWMLSSGYGYNPFISGISGIDGDMCYLSIMYQWQLWNGATFLSTGMQMNLSEDTNIYYDSNEIYIQNQVWDIGLFPIVSLDWRLFSDKKKEDNDKKKEDKKGVTKIEMIIVLLIVGVIVLTSMP